jgi:hypothetical protein
LINNRQGGRRRGRGGQRPQGQGGQPGNRQDNRQRGNAAQLLEKYKSMARDAQLAGDRVQTEYFLQYADHYFRVLGESRSRFEDQRRQRGEDDLEEDEGEEEMEAEGSEAQDERPRREPRRDHDRSRRPESEQQPRRRAERSDEDSFEREERPARRPRSNGSESTLPLSVLPPAIGRGDDESRDEHVEEPQEAARPKRRTRSVKAAEGDDEVAPAA